MPQSSLAVPVQLPPPAPGTYATTTLLTVSAAISPSPHPSLTHHSGSSNYDLSAKPIVIPASIFLPHTYGTWQDRIYIWSWAVIGWFLTHRSVVPQSAPSFRCCGGVCPRAPCAGFDRVLRLPLSQSWHPPRPPPPLPLPLPNSVQYLHTTTGPVPAPRPLLAVRRDQEPTPTCRSVPHTRQHAI